MVAYGAPKELRQSSVLNMGGAVCVRNCRKSRPRSTGLSRRRQRQWRVPVPPCRRWRYGFGAPDRSTTSAAYWAPCASLCSIRPWCIAPSG